MQIKFAEANAKTVTMLKLVDLKQIFGMITYGAKDKEAKEAIDRAIAVLNAYSENYKHHEGNFTVAVKPILRSEEVKKPIGKRKLKDFKK